MKKTLLVLLAALFSFSVGCQKTQSPSAPTPEKASAPKTASGASTVAASSDKVELALIDKLDGVTSHYCIDIAGGNKNIDINKGLQAHTCYSYRGSLGADQSFSKKRLTENALYMVDFDVCATLSSLDAGANVGLAKCDGSELQKISFNTAGELRPLAKNTMCLTAKISDATFFCIVTLDGAKFAELEDALRR